MFYVAVVVLNDYLKMIIIIIIMGDFKRKYLLTIKDF